MCEAIVEQMFKDRGTSITTQRVMRTSLSHYSEFCEMSLQELLNEADAEEENGIRWKRRTLKDRLINYRSFLFENYSERSAKLYFTHVKTFYRHYEIELQSLPFFNLKTANKTGVITHDDIPSKDDIRKAYELAKNPLLKAIILFMSSSGCARTETLNLKVSHFMKATDEFTDETDILSRCEILKESRDHVPIWQVHRQKTDKDYYTFCSTESLRELCKYLLTRKDTLTPESQLFKIHKPYLNTLFRDINTLLGGEKCGAWVKFRPHTLRKYHASTLLNAENGLTIDEIDTLQGRSKDIVHEAYFLEDPTKLREKYVLCLHELTILDEDKAIRVEKEKDELQAQITSQQQKLEMLMKEMEKLQGVLFE